MNPFRVVAPGKLMIAGEYSVLGPSGQALAVAVGPGLALDVDPADGFELGRADGPEHWSWGDAEVPEGLRFVHAALEEALRARNPGPCRLVTEVLGNTGTGSRKPGVGGSASAAVATVAALFEAARRAGGPDWDGDAVLRVALAAHTRAQGGRGSGYDIATIAHGGLVQWRPARLANGGGTLAGVTRGEARTLQWPAALRLVAGYTGQSASTTGLLKRVEAHAENDPASAARGLIALGAPVDGLVAAFDRGDVAAIFNAVRACHAAFVAWDSSLGLGAVTPAVTRMIDLAQSVGAAAKVSGAGGGDSVIALADSDATAAAVRDVWQSAGYAPLDVKISIHGPRESVSERC